MTKTAIDHIFNHRIGTSGQFDTCSRMNRGPWSALTMHCQSVPCVKLPLAEGFVLFRFELQFSHQFPQ